MDLLNMLIWFLKLLDMLCKKNISVNSNMVDDFINGFSEVQSLHPIYVQTCFML